MTSERTDGKNGETVPVCQILIRQQIKLEKNDFDSPKEQKISFHTIQNYYLRIVVCGNLRQKREHISLSNFDVKSNIREKRENGPSLSNSNSLAYQVREKKFTQS